MDSPSARIAAEIRRRITAGELAVGARVPSTRQITSEWGVAMATASRALAALRQEGLVLAVPGVGTVVAGRQQPRAPQARTNGETELTAERIARTAIAVADAEGLAAVSMRRVASELGSATMSLYRHVDSREKLTDLMADTVIGDNPLPDVPRGNWREQLETALRLQWRIFRQHPWLAQTISIARPQLLPNLVEHAEWMLRALDGHGLDSAAMLHAHITAFSFVRATAAAMDSETEARRETGVTGDEWMEQQEQAAIAITASGRYPTLARLIDMDDFDLDFDELFEFGLRRLLDGFALHIEATAERNTTHR